jgi:serine/threonine protein kinase
MEKIRWQDLARIEELGSGEFGKVYRGHYRRQEVAIKKLCGGTREDLEKEIESFRHLSHKRLVKFIGACLELPNLALVTEYMPGGSLHHLLHERKYTLPLHHGVNMCQQLTDGVRYLHAQTTCRSTSKSVTLASAGQS